MHERHVRMRTEREGERDGPAGTHDTSDHREPESNECQNYDGAASGHPGQDGRGDGAKWWRKEWRRKRRRKAKKVKQKPETEGCREAQCCYTGAEEPGRPNPAR
jgi:hypothetical protein